MNQACIGTRQGTRSSRYAYLRSFFNFIRNNLDQNILNPCEAPMFKRIFKPPELTQWNILDKEVVDELIFRTTNPRNRLMLELMARGGMRVSEVLKLKPSDIIDQKLILRDPKSGKEQEAVYIPQKIAERLKEYIQQKEISQPGTLTASLSGKTATPSATSPPYVFKVAISDSRIKSVQNGLVSFHYRKHGSNRLRTMTLSAMEFIRRFLQHVLPTGFMKVRYYGFMHASSRVSMQDVTLAVEIASGFLQTSSRIPPEPPVYPVCPLCGGELVYQ